MWWRACRRRRRERFNGSSCAKGRGKLNPSPLRGGSAERSGGRGGGSPKKSFRYGTPTPDPSPQGGGEQSRKTSTMPLTPTGTLTIGSSDLEYRMVGPAPDV